jgi:ADP-dependent NAD(P)H-hydrate dehydratase / NAD(P)H-hydrate epimerase
LDYVTPDEMSRLERGASDYGMGVKDLMENAGRAVAEFVVSRYGTGRRVCVVCGGGNNGGDGMVAARYLSASCDVEVILLTSPEKIKSAEARDNWRALAGTDASVHVAVDAAGLAESSRVFAKSDVIVVAIFGTGVKEGVVREPYASAISSINVAKAPKVAIDLPSGIDPATGAASHPAVKADVTVALHLPKIGLKGREEFTGEVVVVPIGIRGPG